MIARALVVALGMVAPARVAAQSSQPLANQRDSLTQVLLRAGLDTATTGVLVFYVPGSEKDARELGTLLAASLRYFKNSLVGADIDLALALVDSARWNLITGLPFGLPSSHDRARIAFLPSTPSGPDADAFMRIERGAPAAAIETVRRQYPSWAAGVARMLNLIMLHEVGHVVARSLPIHAPNRWFNEWLASYLAYAFMRSVRPDDAALWEAMCDAMLSGFTPPHRTLTDFESAIVSVDNYVWYQTAFQPRVREVFEAQGLGFVRTLRQEFGVEVTRPPSPADLLERLEKMAPGFNGWAARTFQPNVR